MEDLSKFYWENTESIFSVTEAFSMQPATWLVGKNQQAKKVIRFEERLGAGMVQFYIGIDSKNKPVFKIRADSCTLTYA